jgi:hypothetical protein
MTIDEKTAEYLQGLLKLPHIGSRGLDALYQEVKKQGKAYNTKLKSGLTLENIEEWYILRVHLGDSPATPLASLATPHGHISATHQCALAIFEDSHGIVRLAQPRSWVSTLQRILSRSENLGVRGRVGHGRIQ